MNIDELKKHVSNLRPEYKVMIDNGVALPEVIKTAALKLFSEYLTDDVIRIQIKHLMKYGTLDIEV